MAGRVELQGADGSRATLSVNGAQVLSFIPAGSDVDVLFVSPNAVLDVAGTPVRGGIPVCWPCFGPSPTVGQHGFARKSVWKLLGQSTSAVTMSLDSDSIKAANWPFQWELRLCTSIESGALVQVLTASNKSKVPITFTTCFHNYFAVDDVNSTTVLGLGPGMFIDKPSGGSMQWDMASTTSLSGEVDRVYLSPPERTIRIAGASGGRVVCVTLDDCMDCTLWQPGSERAAQISDLKAHHGFVCVEPVVYGRPARVNPESTLSVSQKISIEAAWPRHSA